MNSPENLLPSAGEHRACDSITHRWSKGLLSLNDVGKPCLCGQTVVHLTAAGLVVENPGYRAVVPLIPPGIEEVAFYG